MSERYSRQKDLVPADRLADCKVSVIGVGAVGRQAALQLAAMGVRNLQLIDHDIVEESNLASQGYYEADLELAKVNATAKVCQAINSEINLDIVKGRFRKSVEIGNVVFCCVDKIRTRSFIWEAVKDSIDFWVDGRMSGEVLRVISASDDASKEYYGSTLFAQSEAQRGSCTAKTTIYCANIAAGRMVSRFALWLRDVPVVPDILISLASDDFIVKSSQ